jgi:kanamycin kinase
VLHDALPVVECPFDWSVERRLARAGDRTHADLRQPPPIDRLVVCHGDACAPNSLLYDDGTFAAHVDLGALGVADRWADLAVAAWSTEWNYGRGCDGIVYGAYGIAPDVERIAYYRRLWDAT